MKPMSVCAYLCTHMHLGMMGNAQADPQPYNDHLQQQREDFVRMLVYNSTSWFYGFLFTRHIS